MRTFKTGATRDNDNTKLDYEGFLSPLVLERYAQYMNIHRIQADGKLRDSDNWQKGIPLVAYIKSLFRHMLDVWRIHRGYETINGNEEVNIEDALCAVIFNASGYLHEYLKMFDNPEETEVEPEVEPEEKPPVHAVCIDCIHSPLNCNECFKPLQRPCPSFKSH